GRRRRPARRPPAAGRGRPPAAPPEARGRAAPRRGVASVPVEADGDYRGVDLLVDAVVAAGAEPELQVDGEARRVEDLVAGRAHEGQALRDVVIAVVVAVVVVDRQVGDAEAALEPELR